MPQMEIEKTICQRILSAARLTFVEWRSASLKELQNSILHIILDWSLFCSIRVYSSLLSTYSFGKLVFLSFCIFVFSAFAKFGVIFMNICNIYIIIRCQVLCVFFSLITFQLNNLWEQIHFIKSWLELLLKKHTSRELLSFKNPI